MLNPCPRESEAKLISDHGLLSSYKGQQEAAKRQYLCGVVSRMHMVLDGCMLARAPASPVQGLHQRGPRYLFFLICMTCGLEKFGLVDQK